jgi:hypothetical protein
MADVIPWQRNKRASLRSHPRRGSYRYQVLYEVIGTTVVGCYSKR